LYIFFPLFALDLSLVTGEFFVRIAYNGRNVVPIYIEVDKYVNVWGRTPIRTDGFNTSVVFHPGRKSQKRLFFIQEVNQNIWCFSSRKQARIFVVFHLGRKPKSMVFFIHQASQNLE
jgi:hypothetical protein